MTLRKYSAAADLDMSYLFDDFPGMLYNNRIWRAQGGSGSLFIATSCVGGVIENRANAGNYLEFNQADRSFDVTRKFGFNTRIKLPNLTSVQSRIGLSGASSPVDAVGLMFDATVGSTWQLQALSGSSQTLVNTGLTVVADTWYEFEMQSNSGIVTCFIDNNPVGNLSSNLPSGSLCPFCRSTSQTTTTRSTQVDWLEVYGERI